MKTSTKLYIGGTTLFLGWLFWQIAQVKFAEKEKEEQRAIVKAKNDSIELANKPYNDSIKKVNDSLTVIKLEVEQKKWEKSKAAKIQKKHPEWTKEDCQRIADNKIWIGMSLDMLKYQRGTPNHANPSNYGEGTNWQWCWDDYTPSCFYGGGDGIITSYN